MNEASNFPDFLDGSSVDAAQQLLGCFIVRDLPQGQVVVKIVEVEAYHQDDAASHSYRGETTPTKTMFGPSGHLYVYFTYGMHCCCNVVTSGAGVGAGALIRAVEPVQGEDILAINRSGRSGRDLTNGPAKLCQAMSIDLKMNGHNLRQSPMRLVAGQPVDYDEIVASPRIGISREVDRLWRFYIKDNPYVSVKYKEA